MDQDRFTKKRNSHVGGGLAKFEGAQAADQFARRQSSHQTRVRQSIPDIRFDEHGMPISTRQLQARSQSLAGGSLFPLDRRYSRDGVRRGSEQAPGGEKNVRQLSKKFSLEDEEEQKANFTIPSNTRTGMFGTNRRWSVKPEWMKKRKSSVKEEFIEKNLSNLELLSPTSRQEVEDEMASILEEMASSDGDKTGSVSDDVSHEGQSNRKEEDSSSASETGSSSEEEYSGSEEEHSHSEGSAEGDSQKAVEQEETNNGEDAGETENQEKIVAVESNSARKPLKSGKRKRKSKKEKKSTNEDLPPRPPPPPLPVQMCDVTEFLDASSSSDEDEETIRTQYGKQKIFVSKCFHVFEITNGPLNEGRE